MDKDQLLSWLGADPMVLALIYLWIVSISGSYFWLIFWIDHMTLRCFQYSFLFCYLFLPIFFTAGRCQRVYCWWTTTWVHWLISWPNRSCLGPWILNRFLIKVHQFIPAKWRYFLMNHSLFAVNLLTGAAEGTGISATGGVRGSGCLIFDKSSLNSILIMSSWIFSAS